MTEYSVDDVRRHAAILRDWRNGFDPGVGNDDAAGMLDAHADLLERIKADEGAVPALVYLGCNNGAPRYQWNCRWNELEAGTEF